MHTYLLLEGAYHYDKTDKAHLKDVSAALKKKAGFEEPGPAMFQKLKTRLDTSKKIDEGKKLILSLRVAEIDAKKATEDAEKATSADDRIFHLKIVINSCDEFFSKKDELDEFYKENAQLPDVIAAVEALKKKLPKPLEMITEELEQLKEQAEEKIEELRPKPTRTPQPPPSVPSTFARETFGAPAKPSAPPGPSVWQARIKELDETIKKWGAASTVAEGKKKVGDLANSYFEILRATVQLNLLYKKEGRRFSPTEIATVTRMFKDVAITLKDISKAIEALLKERANLDTYLSIYLNATIQYLVMCQSAADNGKFHEAIDRYIDALTYTMPLISVKTAELKMQSNNLIKNIQGYLQKLAENPKAPEEARAIAQAFIEECNVLLEVIDELQAMPSSTSSGTDWENFGNPYFAENYKYFDYYTALGVAPTVSDNDIKAVARKLSLRWHVNRRPWEQKETSAEIAALVEKKKTEDMVSQRAIVRDMDPPVPQAQQEAKAAELLRERYQNEIMRIMEREKEGRTLSEAELRAKVNENADKRILDYLNTKAAEIKTAEIYEANKTLTDPEQRALYNKRYYKEQNKPKTGGPAKAAHVPTYATMPTPDAKPDYSRKIGTLQINISTLALVDFEKAIKANDLEGALTIYGKMLKHIVLLRLFYEDNNDEFSATEREKIGKVQEQANKAEKNMFAQINALSATQIKDEKKGAAYKSNYDDARSKASHAIIWQEDFKQAVDQLIKALIYAVLLGKYETYETMDTFNYERVERDAQGLLKNPKADKESKAIAQALADKIKEIKPLIKADWARRG